MGVMVNARFEKAKRGKGNEAFNNKRDSLWESVVRMNKQVTPSLFFFLSFFFWSIEKNWEKARKVKEGGGEVVS